MLTKRIAIMPLKVRPMQHRKTKGNLCVHLPSSVRPSRTRGGMRGVNKDSGARGESKLAYFLPFCFLLFGGALVSCGNSASLGIGGINISNIGGNVTKISDIQQNHNTAGVIFLQGQVATRAPFLAAGAYKLQDATGAIWVMTNQPLPNVGDEVLIKGQLQFQSIPVGGQDLGEVYVQEQQQLQRRAGQPEQPIPTQGRSKP